MNATIGRVAVLVSLSLGVALAAPQAQPPHFGTSNRTVAVYATVTGVNGRLVPDLTRDDFAVDDNGKRQPLTLFSNDIQPITLIMLLDRSGSMKQNFELEERAAEAFVHAMLPGDKARVGSFAKYIQIDPEDFTSDRDALIKILRTELQEDGPTPLWNAVDRGVDKLLIEQGRRAIAHITGTSVLHAKRRADGYRAALKTAGIKPKPEWIVRGGFKEADGYRAMKRLLGATPGVDAVFCANDPSAIGAMKAIWDAGLRIPEDIAVAGAGDIALGDLLRVPLTTVSWSREDQGKAAAELLLERIDNDIHGSADRPLRVVIPPKLVVRRSSGGQ